MPAGGLPHLLLTLRLPELFNYFTGVLCEVRIIDKAGFHGPVIMTWNEKNAKSIIQVSAKYDSLRICNIYDRGGGLVLQGLLYVR